MGLNAPEIIAIAISCFSAIVAAYIALRKGAVDDSHTRSDTRKDNSEAAHNIIAAADAAVTLTRDTSAARVSELEKVVVEFRQTITSLNSQISNLRMTGESTSITLHTALNAMDALHVQIVALQTENVALKNKVAMLEADNKSLREQLAELKNGQSNSG